VYAGAGGLRAVVHALDTGSKSEPVRPKRSEVDRLGNPADGYQVIQSVRRLRHGAAVTDAKSWPRFACWRNGRHLHEPARYDARGHDRSHQARRDPAG